MDDLGLATLKAGIDADCRVAVSAAALARERLGTASDPELEACAFQLVRFYNVVEQMGFPDAYLAAVAADLGEPVSSFDRHFDKSKDVRCAGPSA
jgi:predicted nucleic acid-binding protein